MTRKLYRTPFPSHSLDDSSTSIQRRLSQLGLLEGGGAVENIAGNPESITLNGQYHGDDAELLTSELRELLNADGLEYVALYDPREDLPERGYYATESGSGGRFKPQTPEIGEFAGTLSLAGTRQSEWRSIATTPTQVENDMGTAAGSTAYVGVHGAAKKVRWFDPGQGTEAAERVVRRQAEFGPVDIYDAQASSFDRPTLIFDLEYHKEGDTDVGLWDDYGRGAKYGYEGPTISTDTLVGQATIGAEYSRWQRVYDTGHSYRGVPIADNGLLRLFFDEASQHLAAAEYVHELDTWTPRALGDSSWQLYDFDVTRIGSAELAAQVEFVDYSQSPTAFFALDMRLHRGMHTALWSVPANESGSTPSGLQTKLDPVASSDIVDPQPHEGLVSRRDVRK